MLMVTWLVPVAVIVAVRNPKRKDIDDTVSGVGEYVPMAATVLALRLSFF